MIGGHQLTNTRTHTHSLACKSNLLATLCFLPFFFLLDSSSSAFSSALAFIAAIALSCSCSYAPNSNLVVVVGVVGVAVAVVSHSFANKPTTASPCRRRRRRWRRCVIATRNNNSASSVRFFSSSLQPRDCIAHARTTNAARFAWRRKFMRLPRRPVGVGAPARSRPAAAQSCAALGAQLSAA